jgi:hypothetical protein
MKTKKAGNTLKRVDNRLFFFIKTLSAVNAFLNMAYKQVFYRFNKVGHGIRTMAVALFVRIKILICFNCMFN